MTSNYFSKALAYTKTQCTKEKAIFQEQIKPTNTKKNLFNLLILCFLLAIHISGQLIASIISIHDISNLFMHEVFISSLVIVILYYLLFVYLKPRDQFKDQPLSLKDYLTSICIGYLILLVVSMLTTVFTPTTHNQNLLIELIKTNSDIWSFISIAVIAPIIEELIFRKWIVGFMFNGSIIGVIISSILFGYLHIVDNPSSLLEIIPYLSLGLVIGFVYHYYQNILVSIGLHCLNNGISFFIVLVSIHYNIMN